MGKSLGELEGEYWRRKFASLKSSKPYDRPSISELMPKSRALPLTPLSDFKAIEKPKTAEEQASDATQKEIDRRFGEGDWWGGSTLVAGKTLGDIAEKPGVKNILDAISVFNYAGANIADENLQDIQEGDWNPVSGVSNLFEGIGRGLSGAAGNKEDATTYSKVIKRGQEMAGIDTESKESRAVQGIGGFIGDVALDPTTYIGVGLAKGVIKGGAQGAKFAREANIAKASGKDVADTADYIPGKTTPEYKQFLKENKSRKVLPTSRFKEQERIDDLFEGQKFLPATSRSEATIAGFKQGRDNFREGVVANREARKAKKEAAKSEDQVGWLADNFLGLRPAVALRSAEEIARKRVAETGAKVNKKQLEAETADVLADVRLRVAEKSASSGESSEDVVSEVLSRSDNPGEVLPENAGNAATGSQGNILDEVLEGAGGAKVVDDISEISKAMPEEVALEAGKAEEMARVVSQDFTGMTVKLSQYKKVSESQVVYDVLRNIRVQNIKGEEVGDIREISKALRNVNTRARLKKSPGFLKIVSELEPLTRSTDPLVVAKYLDKISSTAEFRAAAKALRGFSEGGRIKAGNPEAGLRGSAKYAMGDPEDIQVVKTPATKEEGQAFFNDRLEQSNQALMQVPYAQETYKFANELFEEAVGNQALKGGTKTTKRKAVQSGLGPDKGAKYPQKWNTMASIAYLRSALKYASQPKFKNPQMKDAVFVAVVRNVEDRLRAAGVDIHLNNMSPSIPRYSKGSFNTVMTVRLGISDVLEAMGRDARLNVLFNKGNNIPPTVLADTAEMLVRSATKLTKDGRIDMEHVLNMAFLAVSGRVGRNFYARDIKNNLDLITQKNHIFNALVRLGNEDVAAELRRATKTLDDGRVVPYDLDDMYRYIDEALGDGDGVRGMSVLNHEMGVYDGEVLTPLVHSFINQWNEGKSPLNQLIYRNMENTSAQGVHLLEKAQDVTDAKYAEIRDSIANGSPGQVLGSISKDVTLPSNASDIVLAQKAMEEKMLGDFGYTPDEIKQIKASDSIAQQNAKTVGTPHRNAENNAKLHSTKALNDATETAGRLVNDKTISDALRQERGLSAIEELYDITYRFHTTKVNTGIFGIKEKFDAAFGRSITWEKINRASHAHSHIMTAFHKTLNGFARKGITNAPMRESIKRIQQAHKEGVADSLTGIDAEIYQTLSFMFDPSTNNFFTRNSVGFDNFAKNMQEDFGKEADDLLAGVTADSDLGKMWMDWDIEKPMDFLSKMMHTMSRTQEEISMGAEFSQFGSKVAKPGYVKVVDNTREGQGSEFYNLIDKELYYPKEIANEIPYIDKLLTESRYIKSEVVKNALDPIISTLKMTQTTLKPGHHMMSLVGDIWRNSIAGMGGSTKEYGMMGRIMQVAIPQERSMTDVEAFGRAKQIATSVDTGLPRGKSETLMIGGKKVKMGRQELWDIMNQRGVVLPAHIGGVAEDFLTDFGAMASTENKLYGGISAATKGIDNVVNHNGWLNKFAARRDSITRGALFLNALNKRKFKNPDDAFDYAASVVRKWAPVATDLATWESKYARRAIFYYTWIRGITPRIIESSLTRPGLAMVPGKGMYNLAVSQGLDPMSFGDPFPDDGTLFPSWYSERVLGPQWFGNGDMMGISPTSPILDVFNSLGSDVSLSDMNPFRGPSIEQNAGEKFGQTLLGMATPWVKAPYELITGRRIDSGAPIEDDIQYLTDHIGPARTISKITGKTITGANRSEALYEGGMTPEQSEENAAHELINWLTGAGLTNYTSDSATKTAEFQLRDALTKQNKLDERLGR